MAKRPSLFTVLAGFFSKEQLNQNFENIQTAFDNTLSRDGSTPNAMQADLDMDGNDISNAGTLSATSLTLNGQGVTSTASLTNLASASQDGLMSMADKSKLDNLEAEYPVRNTANANLAAALSDGSLVKLAKFYYTVDSSVGLSDSATEDLGVAGLVASPLGEFITPEYFGGAGDDSTDNKSAFEKCWASGYTTWIPEGTWRCTSEASFPTPSSYGGQAWSTDYKPKILGSGMGKTIVKFTHTSGYGWKTDIMDGAGSTQYLGLHIEGIEFVGPGVTTGDLSGLGIAQTRMVVVRDCLFRGFAAGAGVKLYATSNGGLFNPKIEGCYFGIRYKPNGSNGYSLADDLYPYTNRYSVWVNGNNDSGSGVNDAVIKDNQMKNCLVSHIYIRGHGTVTSGNDSCANLRSLANHFFAKPARDVQNFNPSSITSTTFVMPVTTVNTTSGDYVGMRVYIESGTGEGQRREITGDVVSGSTRTITINPGWTTNPDVSSNMNIEWGDPTVNSDSLIGIDNYPSGIFASNIIRSRCAHSQYEDMEPPVVLDADCSDEFKFDSHVENSNGVFIVHANSQQPPGLLLGDRVRGSNRYPTASIMTASVLLRAQGDTGPTGNFGFVHLGTNKEGSDLEDGDVVRLRTSNASVYGVQKTGSNGQDLLSVVYGGSGKTFANDDLCTLWMSGSIAECKVTGTVARGDTLVSSTTAGRAKADNTVTDPKKILGYALAENASGNATITIKIA